VPAARKQTKLVPQKPQEIKLEKLGTEGPSAPIGEADITQVTVADAALRTYPSEFYGQLKIPLTSTVAWMERVFYNYSNSCVCGIHYENNCAHFLTNAMALCGATFPSSLARCPKGRLLRAKEALVWFRGYATGYQLTTKTSPYER
jgi:hypothetical protein